MELIQGEVEGTQVWVYDSR